MAPAAVAAPSAPEVDWKQKDREDEEIINNLLFSQPGAESQLEGLIDDNREFSQEGKADDAEDYGDISDDDLPDDEPATAPSSAEVPGLVDDTGTSHDTDDLFDGPSSPHDLGFIRSSSPVHQRDAEVDVALQLPGDSFESLTDRELRELNFPTISLSNQDKDIPNAPDSYVDLVKQTFPKFEIGVNLNWNEQLNIQPTYRTEKKPPRPPKPLVPTKLSLDFEADQEKLFRMPGPAVPTRRQQISDAEAKGFVSCLAPEKQEADDGNIFRDSLDDDDELVGGFSLGDIELVCDDWETLIDPPTPHAPEPSPAPAIEDEEDEWDREFLEPAPKRRKIIVERGLPEIPRFVAPSFDTFEEATQRASKRIYLDMQDPYLLIDDMQENPPKRPKLAQKQKRMANGRLGRDISQRFNHSNDQAYAQLKESHQSKVRAQHTNVQVEHSRPATKLLWPYYCLTRFGPEPHDYHRPQLKVSKGIGFTVKLSRPHKVSKRDRKGKKVQELFGKSKDLSLSDNSTAVLFEYCEEIPTVLSNFGMGNKIINYYRFKERDEEERPPKPDMGDQAFLQPEDKSPFSIFGTVDPGESVPTLHNPMFHAPIFKHNPRGTDFLFGRTTTGLDGSSYYLRKIDHMYVVGQNFPLQAVPGPHSRTVTSLHKNRLKMVAYRLLHKQGHVGLSDITNHVKDSNDAQNRQKLKEFLHYNKETRSWGLNPGEHLMDLVTINSMIKPEDVCLHDAMLVGKNELAQNGYQVDEKDLNEEDDDEHEREDMANSMVPWKTTKSFIDACSGKAMLQLHGVGDPTGRGLGFSFIKTSMKGGYMGAIQGPAATSADAIERERKANGGHSYNVKKQDALYNDAIRKIWGLQKSSLQDDAAYGDEDVQLQEDEDDRFNTREPPATPAHMDDGMSQMSRPSAAIGMERRQLKITRTYRDSKGELYEKTETVYDPGVIAQYMKQRALLDTENIDPYSVKPTGNQEYDRMLMQRLEMEEARVNRNQERRHAREKQKAAAQHAHDGDPDSPAQSIEKGGTSRKCANCGQKGHIKTNKKLCPMLNGTWKADNRVDEGTFGVYSAPTPSSTA